MNTLVLPAFFLSFLLDRLLQYENVDEDSSGEQGHEKLVEDMVPGTSASFVGPSFESAEADDSFQWFLSLVACPPPLPFFQSSIY